MRNLPVLPLQEQLTTADGQRTLAQILLLSEARFLNLTAESMNLKLLLKTLFLIAILSLLVLMGMHNQQLVVFSLPPLLPKDQTLPAAIMYFGFFAVGVVTGTVLTAGRKKGSAKNAAQ